MVWYYSMSIIYDVSVVRVSYILRRYFGYSQKALKTKQGEPTRQPPLPGLPTAKFDYKILRKRRFIG